MNKIQISQNLLGVQQIIGRIANGNTAQIRKLISKASGAEVTRGRIRKGDTKIMKFGHINNIYKKLGVKAKEAPEKGFLLVSSAKLNNAPVKAVRHIPVKHPALSNIPATGTKIMPGMVRMEIELPESSAKFLQALHALTGLAPNKFVSMMTNSRLAEARRIIMED